MGRRAESSWMALRSARRQKSSAFPTAIWTSGASLCGTPCPNLFGGSMNESFPDLDRLRLPAEQRQTHVKSNFNGRKSSPNAAGVQGEFVKGPIPLDWLGRAAKPRGRDGRGGRSFSADLRGRPARQNGDERPRLRQPAVCAQHRALAVGFDRLNLAANRAQCRRGSLATAGPSRPIAAARRFCVGPAVHTANALTD